MRRIVLANPTMTAVAEDEMRPTQPPRLAMTISLM